MPCMNVVECIMDGEPVIIGTCDPQQASSFRLDLPEGSDIPPTFPGMNVVWFTTLTLRHGGKFKPRGTEEKVVMANRQTATLLPGWIPIE